MPNGRSFNWESTATREREGLETRCVGGLLSICVSVLAMSNGCQKTVLLPVRA